MRLPRKIHSAINEVAQNTIGKDWQLYSGLLAHWPEIVGQDYAKCTTPVKISFPKGKAAGEKFAENQRGNGTLTISLPQGLCMEFSFKSETLRQKINAYFGYPAIGKINLEGTYTKISHKKAPPIPLSADQKKTLDQAGNMFENNELGDALKAFGAALLSKPE